MHKIIKTVILSISLTLTAFSLPSVVRGEEVSEAPEYTVHQAILVLKPRIDVDQALRLSRLIKEHSLESLIDPF